MAGINFPHANRFLVSRRWLGVTIICLLGTTPLQAQMPPDQAADLILNSARKAYNDKNYPIAVARFQEFLGRFGNHKDVPNARYGLALAFLNSPEKNYLGAIEQLQQLTGQKGFTEYPFVLYYLGLAQRSLGSRELSLATAKPGEAAGHQSAAKQRFEEAGHQFAAAEASFSANGKGGNQDAKELPSEIEWAALSRCYLAEMQIRTLKLPEAQATAANFVKDPLLTKSRYCGLGRYYFGYANFLAGDYLTAGRTINMLTPFSDPIYGTHAQYLLARVHHLAEERAEAAEHYAAVLADYEKSKKDAADTLAHLERIKNDADEKVRLEGLVREPAPDHIARSAFFLGVLLYEGGRFADALPRFAGFSQQYPGSPLLAEARLRVGFCQVELRQYSEAIQTLQPLVDKEPGLADQGLLWIGKAQVEGADPSNPPLYDQAMRMAQDTFRKAAERAQQLNNSDPVVRVRRGEILLELADTQQLGKQFKEAAATYGQLLNEKMLPSREEEILQRQATALHLAGDYNGSDQVCGRFLQLYPGSPLLGEVLFRQAENAYFRFKAVDQASSNQGNRDQELANLNDEVIKRYQQVVDKFPESPNVHLANFNLALAFYRKGDLEKAKDILENIKPADRLGELAMVPYVLSDCLIRLTPLKADDALAAGKIQEQLQNAVELLDTFVSSQPPAPQTPDALLKLGYCHQRLAALLVKPEERGRVLGEARSSYEKLMQQFPGSPLQSQAVFERAKCLAQMGDGNGAVNELRRFTNDPLKNSNVAPMALLELSTLLRAQNKAAEAAGVLGQCRQQYETNLLKDPARAGWVVLLQYHQGVALREAGKLTEARSLFDQVTHLASGQPEGAEAALRFGQCLKEEGLGKLAIARKVLESQNPKAEEIPVANKNQEEGLKTIRDAVQYLEGQITQLKEKHPSWEIRARMIYEAAWGYRALGDAEIEASRKAILQVLEKKRQEDAKKEPSGQQLVIPTINDVPLKLVPVQGSEMKAREHYQLLIDSFPDLPLTGDARFEFAEILSHRGDYEGAGKVLGEALDKEPGPELTEKVRLRLGECLAAKGDPKAALTEFDSVAQNLKSPLVGEAQYRAGECHLQLKEWDKAITRLAVFRDQQPFQNLPGLTDRALLRLSHALAQKGQWDQSRQAEEQLVSRFNSSPLVHEARYGIGWAWQNQKQYDNAINAYTQVVNGTATEVGAKAQLQIGLCRLEQKRFADAAVALMAVPYSYDYPELNAAALCEAGRALVELKQPEQASRLWLRVLQDHPASEWAIAARERLDALKKG